MATQQKRKVVEDAAQPARSASATLPADQPASPPTPTAAPVAPRSRTGGFSREKILSVATRMFADRGFSAVSVRDIVQECGITLPTLYHFYGDKDGLYRSCCEASFSANAQRLNAAIASPGTPKDRVRHFTRALADSFLNDSIFRRLIHRELLRREGADAMDITSRYFRNEFILFVKEFEQIDSRPHAVDHAYAIYALTLALVLTRSLTEHEGIGRGILSSPAHLAEYVLSTILPHVNWGS